MEDNAPQPAQEETEPVEPVALHELAGSSWTYLLRRSIAEFTGKQATDLAATLTYYLVLAIAPALIAMLGLLALLGQGEENTQAIVDGLASVLPANVVDVLEPMIQGLTANSTGGIIGVVFGVVTAAWSASGYVKAFSRSMNRLHGVDEGRGFVRFTVTMYATTLLVLVIAVLAVVILTLSGGIAESIGDAIGLGSTAVAVWGVAKYVLLLVLLILLVAVLYQVTPNVRRSPFRWLSAGAAVAIIGMGIAGAAFGIYVRVGIKSAYGTIGIVMAILLFVWIMNTVLLLGAVIDIEVERARELQAGMPAEHSLQLPLRSKAKIEKQEHKDEALLDDARRIRTGAMEAVDPGPEDETSEH